MNMFYKLPTTISEYAFRMSYFDRLPRNIRDWVNENEHILCVQNVNGLYEANKRDEEDTLNKLNQLKMEYEKFNGGMAKW